MFVEIMSSLATGVTAVYDWFCDILTSFGSQCVTFVFGMIFLGVIYRFLLAPAMSHAGNFTGSMSGLTSGFGSDSVRSKEKPHPNFSERG